MNKLKIIRKQLGLSGQGLAVKANASTATITAIERWDYVPTEATRDRIAAALEVTALEVWPTSSTPKIPKRVEEDSDEVA